MDEILLAFYYYYFEIYQLKDTLTFDSLDFVLWGYVQSNIGSSFRQETEGSSGIGTFFGWVMAAIYMGGRLPQICLNVRFILMLQLDPYKLLTMSCQFIEVHIELVSHPLNHQI